MNSKRRQLLSASRGRDSKPKMIITIVQFTILEVEINIQNNDLKNNKPILEMKYIN